MSKTGKRKVELPVQADEVSGILRQMAEQVEQGTLALGGKEIDVTEYDTFSVSFRQSKAGMRLRVKVKYAKDGADAPDGDDSDDSEE